MIIFENDGEADINALLTFGVSVKDNDNPFGYFGTGLKYAIAVLLRTGHTIDIYIGGRRYSVYTEPTTIREQKFDLVYIDGASLHFTTELGVNWAVWEAYRELHCNCMDEDGTIYESSGVMPAVGKTVIIVDGTDIEAAFARRDTLVLPLATMKATESAGDVEMYDAPTSNLYYKGCKVAGGKQYCKTYNLLRNQSLTEDRTLRSVDLASIEIEKLIIASHDEDYILQALGNRDSTEYRFNFYHWNHSPSSLSEEFSKVCNENKDSDEFCSGAIDLVKQFTKKPAYESVELTTEQDHAFEQALCSVMEVLGVSHSPDDFIFVAQLGCRYHVEDTKIIIPITAFDSDLPTIQATLIEALTEYNDFSTHKVLTLLVGTGL